MVDPTPDVAWAVEDLRQRAPALRKRRRYYDGDHDSVLAAGQTTSAELRKLLLHLSDNLCDDVVDEPVSRTTVVSWTGTAAGQGAAADDLWKRNRMAARCRDVFRGAWMLGDGYLMVQADREGQARFHPQRSEQIAVRYDSDQPDAIAVAAKCWRVGKRYRLNLLYPDGAAGGARLERWSSRGTGTEGDLPQPRAFVLATGELADGPDEEPVDLDPEWDGTGHVPLFHFPADEIGRYGRSALTDVIPLQDVLNKSLVDLVVAMEDVALPQRYGTGIQASIQADGTEAPVKRRARPGEMMTIPSPEARLGQYDAADLSQFLEVMASHRAEIARKGYLPPYSIQTSFGGTGGSPTGISLLVQDGRQVKRCNAAIADWSPELREAMAYGLTLEGQATVAADLDIEWAPVQIRDELAQWEVAALKRDAGVPKRQLLLEGGYDEDEVDEWLDDAAAQAEAIGGGRTSPAAAGRILPAPPLQPAGAPAPSLPTA